MKELIFENRYLLVMVIGGLIYCAAEWNNVKAKAYNVMLRAKDLAKDTVLSGGKEQQDWVVDKLMDILPVRVKMFLSKDLLRLLVQNLYDAGLDMLDDGKLNNSIEKEGK